MTLVRRDRLRLWKTRLDSFPKEAAASPIRLCTSSPQIAGVRQHWAQMSEVAYIFQLPIINKQLSGNGWVLQLCEHLSLLSIYAQTCSPVGMGHAIKRAQQTFLRGPQNRSIISILQVKYVDRLCKSPSPEPYKVEQATIQSVRESHAALGSNIPSCNTRNGSQE